MPAEPARVLLLGSAGFVGRALSRRFSSSRAVRGLDIEDLDLTRPDAAQALARELEEPAVTVFAARPSPDGGFAGELRMAETAAEVLRRSPPPLLVWFSTLAVYGDAKTDLAIREDTPVAPTGPYGRAKAEAERIVRGAAGRTPLLVLRPCKLYGPGAPPGEYGPASFLDAVRAGRPVRVYGDGSELRDHLYVEDLARAVEALVDGAREGTFNLASGRSRTFEELLCILRRLSGRDIGVERMPRTRPKVDQRVDIARLLGALPGFRTTDLPEGLEETWLRST